MSNRALQEHMASFPDDLPVYVRLDPYGVRVEIYRLGVQEIDGREALVLSVHADIEGIPRPYWLDEAQPGHRQMPLFED